MRHVFFILLRATPAWLRLSRAQRRALSDQHPAPLLQGPLHHYFFIEHLRDSPMFTVPYFELRQIIAAIEDGYQAFEQAAAHAPPGWPRCAAPGA